MISSLLGFPRSKARNFIFRARSPRGSKLLASHLRRPVAADRTMHIIVDKSHNILSKQSKRESDGWNYRLEQFEEIIKEGREFGIFVAIADQRLADIPATIVSQLHNFLTHRLVIDEDLFLIDTTISTLDGMSRGLIPSPTLRCCVVAGTAFDLPMVIKMERLHLN